MTCLIFGPYTKETTFYYNKWPYMWLLSGQSTVRYMAWIFLMGLVWTQGPSRPNQDLNEQTVFWADRTELKGMTKQML